VSFRVALRDSCRERRARQVLEAEDFSLPAAPRRDSCQVAASVTRRAMSEDLSLPTPCRDSCQVAASATRRAMPEDLSLPAPRRDSCQVAASATRRAMPEALSLQALARSASGGGRGIRTPGTVSRTVVFKTTAIDRSAIPPQKAVTVVGSPRLRPSLLISHFGSITSRPPMKGRKASGITTEPSFCW
jgi:hypothetical protein